MILDFTENRESQRERERVARARVIKCGAVG